MRPLLIALLVFLAGCAEKKPDRLALDPSGPFRFDRLGQTEELKVTAFAKDRPFVKPVPAEWTSSDKSVFTVDEKGKITCTGSGKATLSAEAWALTATAEVTAVVVGAVEVKDDAPKPFKLKMKPYQLKVTVKDDKGNVIDKPDRVMFKATDYCVEVDDNGLMTPLADGDCDVIVSAADKSARIKLQVRE